MATQKSDWRELDPSNLDEQAISSLKYVDELGADFFNDIQKSSLDEYIKMREMDAIKLYLTAVFHYSILKEDLGVWRNFNDEQKELFIDNMLKRGLKKGNVSLKHGDPEYYPKMAETFSAIIMNKKEIIQHHGLIEDCLNDVRELKKLKIS